MGSRLVTLVVAAVFSVVVMAGGVAASDGGAAAFQRVIDRLSAEPVTAGEVQLAAHAEPHGLWRIANRAGERFSAASPDELKRGIAQLGGADGLRVRFLVTAESLFASAKSVNALPLERGEARVLVGAQVFAIDVTSRNPLLVVRPHVLLGADDVQTLDGMLWHLMRPLDRARLRMIALDRGGPNVLSRTPRADPASKAALIDDLDVAALPTALSRIAGQTAVLFGRVVDGSLVTRGASGVDNVVALQPLSAAAVAGDVGIIVLEQSSAAQPGGRNWLYQTIAPRGLDRAAQRPLLADFIEALSGSNRIVLRAEADQDGRLAVAGSMLKTGGGAGVLTSVTRSIVDVAAEAMGRTPVVGLRLRLPGPSRQAELDRRLVSWLPSYVSWGYPLLILAGLFGAGASWPWFERVWPAERSDDYAGAVGLRAAQFLRRAVFALVFMPLAAVFSVPARLLAWRRAG